MSEDNHEVSDKIMHTYYAQSRFPTDEEELRRLGIDPSRVFRIHYLLHLCHFRHSWHKWSR